MPCLQLLYNTAFSTGSEPWSLKTSLVTPIFKNSDATDTTNYRPKAVGEPLSRLYASILVQRLVHFTEQRDTPSKIYGQLNTYALRQYAHCTGVSLHVSLQTFSCT
ncbi:TPA: hypothetical protein ACH3X1_013186 [Trebouxia sp. C0004]